MRRTEKQTAASGEFHAAGVVCELLEGRVLFSKATVVDAREYYWAWNPDRKIGLLRVTDEVVVGLQPMSTQRQRRLFAAINAPAGALAGYSFYQQLGLHAALYRRIARGYSPRFEVLQERVKGYPGLDYFTPTFIQTIDMGRVAVTDSIEVDLQDNVDSSAFFGGVYTNISAALGTNSWYADMISGGGLDLVHRVMDMHSDARVEHAIPNFSVYIIPS